MVLGTKLLFNEHLPPRLKKLYQATVTFKQYMTDVYEAEKNRPSPKAKTLAETL
jgi:hypothetical protein